MEGTGVRSKAATSATWREVVCGESGNGCRAPNEQSTRAKSGIRLRMPSQFGAADNRPREAIMTRRRTVGALTLAIMLGAGASGAWGHGEKDAPRGTPPEKLGKVDFTVSCNAAAQEEFNRAMALFHSFWFDPAKKSFSKVLQHDPECGMAHWGIAIMSMGNPFAWPPSLNALKVGAMASAESQRVGA